jgi:hypothetical protein
MFIRHLWNHRCRSTAVPQFLTEHRIKKYRNFSLHNYWNGENVITTSVIFVTTSLALSNIKQRKIMWAWYMTITKEKETKYLVVSIIFGTGVLPSIQHL